MRVRDVAAQTPRPTRRWRRRLLVLTVVAMLLPVPWRHVSDSVVGLAWGLDTRLVVDGERIDPPGQWSWLTVGRPALVGELVWQRVRRTIDPESPAGARDLRAGSISSRPAHVEAVAAAVGLQRAGHDLQLGLRVQVRDPVAPGLPERAELTIVNGRRLTDRATWREALAATRADGHLTLVTAEGVAHVSPDGRVPYRHVEVIDLAPPGTTAAVGGTGPPYSWIRSMAMGSSHGLMVGLTTYAAASGEDLAAGRHVAGTGRLLGDGSVGTIGGLRSKAGAARRAGADVLLVPAGQVHQLDDLDLGRVRVLAVTSIDDAIEQLRATAPR